MKRIILKIIDVSEEIALECVKKSIQSKRNDCIWAYTVSCSNNARIIVFDKINKSSITYTVYKEQ